MQRLSPSSSAKQKQIAHLITRWLGSLTPHWRELREQIKVTIEKIMAWSLSQNIKQQLILEASFIHFDNGFCVGVRKLKEGFTGFQSYRNWNIQKVYITNWILPIFQHTLKKNFFLFLSNLSTQHGVLTTSSRATSSPNEPSACPSSYFKRTDFLSLPQIGLFVVYF